MNMKNHINVSIINSPGSALDISIPKEMTVSELLGELKKINLMPDKDIFSIKELNRGIVLTDTDHFDQFQIADGDKLQLDAEEK